MGYIGVILGILLTLGSLVGFSYYGFTYLHTIHHLNAFASVGILFVAYTVFFSLLAKI